MYRAHFKLWTATMSVVWQETFIPCNSSAVFGLDGMDQLRLWGVQATSSLCLTRTL